MKKLIFISALLLLNACATVDQGKTSSAKDIVVSFFEMGFVERNPIAAAEKYISKEKYIQHNPQGADGRQAFIEGFAAYIISSDYSCEIKRVIAEGNLVVIHSHCKESSADRGAALVDIFRVENNLIVEHWDVEQKVPEESANNNSMF